jgi:light-regulated signal transduction histidine kinase (bacteriophytochrome)
LLIKAGLTFQGLYERSEYRGTGMGLGCDKIIYIHKGSITCKSALVEEATFIMSLSEKPADLFNSTPLKNLF